MSFKLKNTEVFLTKYADKLIRLAQSDLAEPRSRTYSSVKFGNRTINSPINTSNRSLSQSLKLEKQVVGKGDFFTFNVKGNEYGERVDEGTPAGSSPKINDIITWINNKPVTLLDASQNKLSNITEKGKTRIASLIAQRINREGIKPTNFLTDLVNKEIDKILGISTEIVKDINLDIDGFMQKLGYSKQGNTFKLHK